MLSSLPAALVCRQHYFLCMPKESNQRKGTTPKNTAILLSHFQTTLIAMQNFVFTQGVDYPPHIFLLFTRLLSNLQLHNKWKF
jgi:hypothetical protein